MPARRASRYRYSGPALPSVATTQATTRCPAARRAAGSRSAAALACAWTASPYSLITGHPAQATRWSRRSGLHMRPRRSVCDERRSGGSRLRWSDGRLDEHAAAERPPWAARQRPPLAPGATSRPGLTRSRPAWHRACRGGRRRDLPRRGPGLPSADREGCHAVRRVQAGRHWPRQSGCTTAHRHPARGRGRRRDTRSRRASPVGCSGWR